MQKELANYKRVIDALKEYSPNAKIFALIHKVDLIPRDQQAKVFAYVFIVSPKAPPLTAHAVRRNRRLRWCLFPSALSASRPPSGTRLSTRYLEQIVRVRSNSRRRRGPRWSTR